MVERFGGSERRFRRALFGSCKFAWRPAPLALGAKRLGSGRPSAFGPQRQAPSPFHPTRQALFTPTANRVPAKRPKSAFPPTRTMVSIVCYTHTTQSNQPNPHASDTSLHSAAKLPRPGPRWVLPRLVDSFVGGRNPCRAGGSLPFPRQGRLPSRGPAGSLLYRAHRAPNQGVGLHSAVGE